MTKEILKSENNFFDKDKDKFNFSYKLKYYWNKY